MKIILSVIGATLLVQLVTAPPPRRNEPDKKHEETKDVEELEDFGLEYNRYLKEVIDLLESDPEFKKKLENVEEADIRSGKIARELEFVDHRVRNKLDEVKRQEIERLRQLAQKQYELTNGIETEHVKVSSEHLDHENPHTFEMEDLKKLIAKVSADLNEADEKRRQEFKEYKMQKEFEKQQRLKHLEGSEREEFEKQLKENERKHKQHEALHHPGSKQQLEEVWEKQDHMDNQEFDPKVFFQLHATPVTGGGYGGSELSKILLTETGSGLFDVTKFLCHSGVTSVERFLSDLDGNGFWDQTEVKTLFLKELDKMYESKAPEDDMKERAEEMERMREHVFSEADKNKDGLISYDEFMEKTKQPDFERDPGWESLDQKPAFTQEEYLEFEKRRMEEVQRMIQQGLIPPQPVFHPAQGYHPQVQYPQYHQYQDYQGGAQYPAAGQHPVRYAQDYPNPPPQHGYPNQQAGHAVNNQQYHQQNQQQYHHQNQQQQQYQQPQAHPNQQGYQQSQQIHQQPQQNQQMHQQQQQQNQQVHQQPQQNQQVHQQPQQNQQVHQQQPQAPPSQPASYQQGQGYHQPDPNEVHPDPKYHKDTGNSHPNVIDLQQKKSEDQSKSN